MVSPRQERILSLGTSMQASAFALAMAIVYALTVTEPDGNTAVLVVVKSQHRLRGGYPPAAALKRRTKR